MNILSFQFEDFFQHFSWGGTSGDELHQVCFVWDSFYFSFIFVCATPGHQSIVLAYCCYFCFEKWQVERKWVLYFLVSSHSYSFENEQK